MASMTLAGPVGYTSATTSTSIAARLRRRAQWAIPMIGWNLGMLYVNMIGHSPVLLAISAGSLAVSAIVTISEPDDIEV